MHRRRPDTRKPFHVPARRTAARMGARPDIHCGAAAIMLAAAVFIDRIISHELYAALYVFLPLTAVNTLVSYRAGGFSMSQKPVVALTDAVVSSLGFGLVICIVSGLREIAAYGTLWEKPLNFSVVLSRKRHCPTPHFCCWGLWRLSAVAELCD